MAFSKTLSNWKVKIINSFCISKADYNVSKDSGVIDKNDGSVKIVEKRPGQKNVVRAQYQL